MNCEVCKRLLTINAGSSALPTEVAAHLASCPSCRALWSRLERIEANIARIPSPTSKRKDALISFFLQPPLPATAPRGSGWRVLSIKKIGVAAAAAAILIGVGIWLSNRAAQVFPPGPVPEDKETVAKKDIAPLVAEKAAKSLAGRILECDLDLARTSDPADRVEILARLAQVIREESRVLAGSSSAKELQTLARLHGRVLTEGLVPRARELPMKQRRLTLGPIAESLLESAERLEKVAPRAKGLASRSMEELTLATAATARELKGMIDEATP